MSASYLYNTLLARRTRSCTCSGSVRRSVTWPSVHADLVQMSVLDKTRPRRVHDTPSACTVHPRRREHAASVLHVRCIGPIPRLSVTLTLRRRQHTMNPGTNSYSVCHIPGESIPGAVNVQTPSFELGATILSVRLYRPC